jgi:ribose transport system ATP-binding protein
MSVTTDQTELRLEDVTKSFGGVRALKGVSLEVRAGEVHALLGENGAGKSTLMAVAAGSLVPDSGTVQIGGQPLVAASPQDAIGLGLAVVYQHPAIADDLSVMENLMLALPPERRPSFRQAPAWAWEKLEAVGAKINPARRAASLNAAEHQLVEIAKALALQPRVLVLDEPTAALGAAEVDHLFDQVRAIRERGTAVVYISHRIPEVIEIADRLTVLRDGSSQGTFAVEGLHEDDILNLIVGRQIDAVFPDKFSGQLGEPVLSVSGLSSGVLDDVAMQVRAGEVVGLAGVAGNGQAELIRALAGLESHSGTIELSGRSVKLSSPVAAREHGIAYVPADRQREGLFSSLSVRENASATSLGRVATAGFVSPGGEREAVARESAALKVKAASPEIGVMTLSGGNQQKVVFARALLSEPEVLLCDEPTQGVDVGARVEIYSLIRQLADAGKGVVVCSSDALELEGLCDRVYILSRGAVVAELEGDQVTEQNITGAAVRAGVRVGATRHEGSAVTSAAAGLAARGGSLLAPLAKLRRGDNVATPIVALLIVILAIVTTAKASTFLGSYNIENLLELSTALIFVALGQQIVLLTGGVDLSVGPMMGLGVVLLIHTASQSAGTGGLILGIVELLAAGGVLGLINGGMIRWVKIPPVVATLATYIAVTGVALIINPTASGILGDTASIDLNKSIGMLVPWAFVIVVALTIVMELVLRRRRAGMAIRAVGSSEATAHRLGLRVGTTVIAAYILCGMLAGLAAVMLTAQIGTGDATAGQQYTLDSIAAVVVGGASIFGGRGTFIGALLGALLLTEVTNALPFLQLGNAWQFWVPGAVVLIAAGAYARATRTDQTDALEATSA